MTILDRLYQHDHSPCEHFAWAGFQCLSAWTQPDAAEDDDDAPPDCWRQWYRPIVLALAGDRPEVNRDRKAKDVGDAPEKEPLASLSGHRIDWHLALPEIKTWAGRMTLKTIIDARREAIHAEIEAAIVDPMGWRPGLGQQSGLDPRSVTTALDCGFSPDAQGMDVAAYAAAELLAILGMQVSPITRFASGVYGYQTPDVFRRPDRPEWWQFHVRPRGGYYRMLTMSTPRHD